MTSCYCIDLHNLVVNLIVITEVRNFEEIDFEFIWWIEVGELEILQFVLCIWLFLIGCDHVCCFVWEFFCDFKQLSLDFSNWPLLDKHIAIEVLYEELGDEVEVLFIVLEDFLHQIINLIDWTHLELVLCDQFNYLEDLLLHNLIFVNWYFSLSAELFTEVGFKRLNKFFEFYSVFGTDRSTLSPHFSFFIKLLKSFF